MKVSFTDTTTCHMIQLWASSSSSQPHSLLLQDLSCVVYMPYPICCAYYLNASFSKSFTYLACFIIVLWHCPWFLLYCLQSGFLIIVMGCNFLRAGMLMFPLSISQMIHEWVWCCGRMILTGETEVSKESFYCSFDHYKSHMDQPGHESRHLHMEKPVTNHLCHGTLLYLDL